MPPVITTDTWLVVNDVPLNTPAWDAYDLSALLEAAPVRGADVVIPLTAGRRPYPRRRDASVRTIPLNVFGDHDLDGVLIGDVRQGLIDNAEYLTANLGIGLTTGDGTVEVSWHRYDGSIAEGRAHVLGLIGWVTVAPGYARTTLDLSIPTGALTVTGS